MYLKNRHLRLSIALMVMFVSVRLYANPSSYGLELQAGGSSVATSTDYEIDKSGTSLGAMLFAHTIGYGGIWGFGLGGITSKLEGDRANRGVKQELSLNLVFLDLRYLYLLNESFSVGPSVRGFYGKGAQYGVVNNDDIDVLFAPGLVLQYEWKNADFRPAASLSYYVDTNIASRRIQTYLVGLSIAMDCASETKDEAGKANPEAPPAPTPAEPEPKAEAAAQPQILELTPPTEDLSPEADAKIVAPNPKFEAIVFTFAPNSSLLSREAKAQIKRLAKMLVADADLWSKITVSGHTDKSGDPVQNKHLSQKRAEAMCKRFTTRGVPKQKLTCVGKDSQELLPGLPDNAPEHRRIELRFEEYDVTKAAKFKDDIDHALQK